ncbi:hypothetical protein MMC26_001439 [Xylographa opegraphella]|nr:hypothetical protein [Xylographa opegraphella]
MAVVFPHGKALLCRRAAFVFETPLRSRPFRAPPIRSSQRRTLQTEAHPPTNHPNKHDFAFAFDIDGVLLRSSAPLPSATRTLHHLQQQRIPFVLLTNGGGKPEAARAAELSRRLRVPLDAAALVQSHSPFADLVRGTGAHPPLRDACVLVTGADGEACRGIAEMYGFTNVITPADILAAHPTIWPFRAPAPTRTRALPGPKIDAIFIYNDPRDWALDTQLILDLLLSQHGHLGTVSARNGDPALPNRGYQQHGQPALFFSNPDLLFAAAWPRPRLGQGAFQAALRGVWAAVTGGAELACWVGGKPGGGAFTFAERRLEALRGGSGALRRVYMVGDNPASDIQGANDFRSPRGTQWRSILVRSGVYDGEAPPAVRPDVVVDGVWEAVRWALEREGWRA